MFSPGARPSPDGDLARFLLLFALAHAGVVVAYIPLLSLLLPLKIAAMPGGGLGLLTVCALAGAVAASVGNIVFGALSDRTYSRRRSRRRWIAAGLAATAASYAGVAAATSPAELVTAVVLYQLAVNMLLAPVLATMADAVPDRVKGLAGGLLALAQPVAALVGAAATGLVAGEGAQLALVVGCLVALVTPLLIAARPPALSHSPPPAPQRAMRQGDLALLWLSRLAIQTAGSVLFTYLLFYFATLEPGVARGELAARVGRVTALVLLGAMPVALVVGRASDRLGARKPFLFAAALAVAAGIAGMALARDWTTAVACYALFGIANASFAGLQSAYAMQLLPSPHHRGRDLGLFNLANTVPALLGPTLTWTLAGGSDFGPTLALLAMLAIVGGLLVLPVRGER